MSKSVKPIFIHFYRAEDCLGPDGTGLDYEKMARARAVGSVPGRAEALFRMHLKHLGFWISRFNPELEGRTLEVELVFLGQDGEPRRPVLAAFNAEEMVAQIPVSLDALNISPFLSVLVKRRPDLMDADLYFTVRATPSEEFAHDC